MSHVDPKLRRELFGWYSHRLGMDMPIVRYGHWGPALLLFPTAGGEGVDPILSVGQSPENLVGRVA